MIILDTNVISEPMRPEPEASAVEWLNEQHNRALYTTTVNVMELRFGLERLPDGKRKDDLWKALEFTLSRLVGPRILPFDLAAADEAARIAAMTEAAGKKTGAADGQIAAIAKTRGFAVATRDVDPFKDAGVEIINPWNFQIT
ncbi:MAG: type II toxin-antitoxin system VapC family toxin [Roseibium sp.]|uniref:type II toxin-antitoxin system VapC family toxin n=1 Tax=Roseibium sp. TaxID=1936156 RepID=UPI002638834F|nr:type II toxin-antitoxin system VapC family toxin [Roseibium sp.]MCV0423993.1 type II toxin-antitoxin system VapC family toxin [Roseibium sp.]